MEEMEKRNLVSLKDIKINDHFWNRYLELVLKEVIPYQWDILNDCLENVETSHSIRNFRIAAGLVWVWVHFEGYTYTGYIIHYPPPKTIPLSLKFQEFLP